MGIIVYRLQGFEENHQVSQKRDARWGGCGLGQYGETGTTIEAETLTTIQASSTLLIAS
jgi:hypothetical protein